MTQNSLGRRRFLARLLVAGAIAPVVLASRSNALAADSAQCYDPAALPLAQKRQRRAIGYVEPSTDPAKKCGGCAFFSPNGRPASCGKCQLLSGGPVTAVGLCNSFARKAG